MRKLVLFLALLLVVFGVAEARFRNFPPHGGGAGPVAPPPPPTASLSALPTTIVSGDSSTLTWSSTDATSCVGLNADFNTGNATAGSTSVSPAVTTVYNVSCSGLGGSASAAATITVTSQPVVTASLSANPTAINVGSSSTLTWGSTNATSCAGTGFSTGAATSGSVSVSPTVTTDYSVTCTGASGQASASANVAVSGGVAGGNCVTGATADGCVIFAGSTKTLVANGGAGPTWSFDNASCFVNCVYTHVTNTVNGGTYPDGRWIDGGYAGDAIMLCSTCGGPYSNVYVRGFEKFWYNVSPSNHTDTGQSPSPSFTTIAATPQIYGTASGSAVSLGITAPVSNLYSQSALTITVDQLPAANVGTITLSDGVTPVTTGQSLSVAQLTGLKFLPAATAKNYQQTSSFAYLVQDPARQGAVGYAAVGLQPSGLWADPSITQLTGAGVDFAPTLSQPAAVGDLVAIRVQNPTGSTFASGASHHFGQVFIPGTVQPTDTLCARGGGSGSCLVYVQMNVKATNEDGSVRHAIIAFNQDTTIAASASRDFMLSKCGGGGGQPSCPGAPTAARDNTSLASTGYDVQVTRTYGAGGVGSDTTSCKNILSAANSGSAPVRPASTEVWANGPVLKAYVAKGTANSGKLKVQCIVYSYSDQTVYTELVDDSTWGINSSGGPSASGKSDMSYDLSVSTDGFTQTNNQFNAHDGVRMFLYGLYEHTVSVNGHAQALYVFDIPYLMATGAVPDYDLSIGVADSWANSANNLCGGTSNGGTVYQPPTGCYKLNINATGNLTADLTAPGPREELAWLANYTTQWLMAQNMATWTRMLGNSRMLGNIPVNFTDESTGYPINPSTVTNFRNGTGLPNGDPCQSNNPLVSGHCTLNGTFDGQGNCIANCSVGGGRVPINGTPFFASLGENGVAHAPAVGYVPYMVTGNYYFMELEAYRAISSIVYATHSYGSPIAGDIGFHKPGGAFSQFYENCKLSNYPCYDASQTRTFAWGFRDLAFRAYLLPDLYPVKNAIVTQLSNSLARWVDNHVGVDMSAPYGALRSIVDIIQPNAANPTNTGIPYHAMSLGNIARFGISAISPIARRFLRYEQNHDAGMLIMGQQGFAPFNGASHGWTNACLLASPECSAGGVANPPTGDTIQAATGINSWSLLYAMNNAGPTINGTATGFYNNQGWMLDGNCQAADPFQQGGIQGGECIQKQNAMGVMASSVPTPDLLAASLQGWAYADAASVQAMVAGSGANYNTFLTFFQSVNQFSLVPRLPDGKTLNQSNTKKQFGGASAMVCSTSPCALEHFVETGSTYNQSSTNSSGYDIFSVMAVGGSQPGGSFQPGAGGGGGGTGTMTCSPNGADCYMFGGCGAGTFNGGAGNDVISLGGNCYGALAAQTVRFRTNTSGKTKQVGYGTDYSGNVGVFRPGTDTLNIATGLDGTGVTTAASVMARCTTNAAGDAVFNFDGGITLKGVTCAAANLQNSITVN